MVSPDPKQLLDDLKASATARKCNSLELIYQLLESQAKGEIKDFSIATIGRLSADAGGPSTQAIRNKGGEDYRMLIDVFAAAQGVTRKKPAKNKETPIPGDYEVLNKIDDPAVRAVMGVIIHERNRYRNELRILKSNTSIVVDRRPVESPALPVEVLSSLSGLLTESQKEALEHAISDKLLSQRGWLALPNGQVKDENGRHLYKPGYITAIQKIIND